MNILRDYFTHFLKGTSAESCPEPYALWSWVKGEVDHVERERLMTHTHQCASCMEKLSLIAELKTKPAADRPLPRGLEEKILQRTAPGGASEASLGRKLKTHLWFFPFLVFISASFVVREYFVQLLVLALVSAGKWLIDTRAHYTRISIIQQKLHDAGEESAGSRLGPRDFESKR